MLICAEQPFTQHGDHSKPRAYPVQTKPTFCIRLLSIPGKIPALGGESAPGGPVAAGTATRGRNQSRGQGIAQKGAPMKACGELGPQTGEACRFGADAGGKGGIGFFGGLC